MADNTTLNTGSGGDVIATDDLTTLNGGAVSGFKVQRVKVGYGSDASLRDVDSSNPLPALLGAERAEDAAHSDGHTGIMALGVRNYAGAGTDGDYSAFNVDSVGAQIVRPRPSLDRIAVNVTGVTTATTAYTAGDQVGAQITFTDAARASGGNGYITGATFYSDADIIGAYDLVIFDQSATIAADNAAFSLDDTNGRKVVAVLPLSGAYDLGNNRMCQLAGIRVPYVCSGSANLYGALVTRLGHTFFAVADQNTVALYLERG
jgi:hypothetical protein